MKNGDATPFAGCDSFLFSYQVFIQGLSKVSEGKWRLSLGDKHFYYSHATVTDSYTLCPISVSQSITFSYCMNKDERGYGLLVLPAKPSEIRIVN